MKAAVLLVGACWIGVGSLAAQSPSQRDSIEQFREQLGSDSDSVVLGRLEAQLIERAKQDRDNAMLHLRLGFLAHRLGEVTGDKQHYDDAGSEFEWAGELQPDWPYAWYGLGLAELALGESSVIALENIRQMLGIDYLSKAGKAFARATEVDPAFGTAVVDLAEVAMRQKVRARTEAALAAVRATATTEAGRVPAVLLARGRLERRFGDADSALMAFERYIQTGGDSAVGALEEARTLFLLGRARDASRQYYRGAQEARSSTAVAMYRQDIGWIAKPEELTAFDSLGESDRAAWLHEFWRKRDLADAREPGDRLAEHYRRYFYALDHYQLVSRHRRYGVENPYRTEQRTFDDRGLIYLRHGEPTRRATYSGRSVETGGEVHDIEPNESWLYVRPDGNLIFHFVAAGDVQDYKLVESLTDVLGLDLAVRLQAAPIVDLPQELQGLFDSRVGLDPLYQRLGTGQYAGRSGLLATERRRGARAIEIGTTTDGFPLTFRGSLDAQVSSYVVSDRSGTVPELLLQYAVPAQNLARERLGDSLRYRLKLRVVAGRPDAGNVAFLDTTRVFVAADSALESQQVTGYLTLRVPVGGVPLQVVVADPLNRTGDLLRQDTIGVPDFAAHELSLSDLVLGRSGTGLSWARGADTVHLNPAGGYPVTLPVEVYYEVHGLDTGAPYHTRVEVRKVGGGSPLRWLVRLFGGGGPPIALTFDGRAEGDVTRVTHEVDIGALSPGRYRLKLTVSDGDGRRVERTAEFQALAP